MKKLKGARRNKGSHLRRQGPAQTFLGSERRQAVPEDSSSAGEVKEGRQEWQSRPPKGTTSRTPARRRRCQSEVRYRPSWKAAFNTAFPLTVIKIKVLAGTLRDAGYKSASIWWKPKSHTSKRDGRGLTYWTGTSSCA